MTLYNYDTRSKEKRMVEKLPLRREWRSAHPEISNRYSANNATVLSDVYKQFERKIERTEWAFRTLLKFGCVCLKLCCKKRK